MQLTVSAAGVIENRVQPDAPGASWPDGRDWFVQWQLGVREAAGDVVVNTQTALTYSVVWRCISYISSTIASLSWHVYEESEDGKSKLPIHDNIAWTLEMQASPEMSALDFRQVMLRDVLLWGNAYAEIERNGMGRPLWLWRIDPARVSVERDATGRLFYRVTSPNGGTDGILDPVNVFHLKGLSPDGLVGYSPIAVARRAIELGLQEEQYGVGFFRRGPTPGGFLKAPGAMKEEERRAMGQSFNQNYGGARSAGKVAVLSGGMEFIPFSMPNSDAQFLESRSFQAEEVCRLYGVPQHIAGILTHSSFSNIEHQGIEAVQYCLYPWCRRLETEADVKLFGRIQTGRRRTRLDLRTLLRGDSAAQTSTLTSQVTGGLRTVNEARDQLDLNPIEGGDTALIQGAMVPLTQVINPSAPPAAPGAPGAAPATPAAPVEPPELLSTAEVIQSRNYDCGAACVQIVSEFYGVGNDRTEDDYIAELGTTAKDGTSPESIVDVLNDAGLVTTSGNGMTLDDLAACFRKGWPVIVPMQEAPANANGTAAGHWVVVIGAGLGLIFLQDPVSGRIMLDEDEFDARWHDLEADGVRSEHFGIVVADGFGYGDEAEEAEETEMPAPTPEAAVIPAANLLRRLRAVMNEFDESNVERDDSGKFSGGGGGGSSEDDDEADPEQEKIDAQRDEEDAAVESSRNSEDAAIQEQRDKEDAADTTDRAKEDTQIEKDRAKEDAVVEKADEKIEKERAKEDSKAEKAGEKLEGERADEDAGTEGAREYEDNKISGAREKEDRQVEKSREKEDAATEKGREKEDKQIAARNEKIEGPLEDAYNETANGSPEEAAAKAAWDAAVEKNDQEFAAVQESRDKEDEAAGAKRETEDKGRESAREQADAKLTAERDKEDAETQAERDKENEAIEAEDKARQAKREQEDAGREEAAEQLQADREEEDADLQAERDAKDHADIARRDKEDKERAAKREQEDKAAAADREKQDAERNGRRGATARARQIVQAVAPSAAPTPSPIAAAFAPLLADVYARLLRFETDKAERTKPGEMNRHLAAFYAEGAQHPRHVAASVRPVLDALLAAAGRKGDAVALSAKLAADHARQSVADLAVGDVTVAWAARPGVQAKQHLQMILRACGGEGSGVPGPCPGEGGKEAEPKKFGKSKADVKVAPGSNPDKVAKAMKAVFGKKSPALEEMGSLVGAPDDAKVSVGHDKKDGKDVVTVSIDHPEFTAERYIFKNASGVHVKNDEFFVKSSAQGKGIGADVFGRQVEQCKEMGIASIRCHAAKENPQDSAKPHNGYYTWPRFGYDADVEEDNFDRKTYTAIKGKFPDAESLSDVMSTREGRDWWKEKGGDIYHAKFDLAAGSRSMLIHDAYQAERAKKKAS